MIKEAKELRIDKVKNLQKGEGVIEMIHLLEKEEFHGHGRLFARFIIEPGDSIGYHIHENEQEVYYLLKGQGLYNNNGKEIVLKEGDTALCKNGEGHSIKNTGEGDLEFIALIVNI